jgi:putative ABC transport system permease protein
MSDLRHALRGLIRQPGFSLVAILTLGLGIGATTAIFTVVDAVILQPLPYPDPDRVVVLQSKNPSYPNPISLSVLNYPDLRDQTTSFNRVGVMRNLTMNLTGTDEPVRIPAKMLSADVFDTLQVPPAKGRVFNGDDDKAGAAPVAVISYALWQSKFGGADTILNNAIQLDGRPVTVVGIMPASFRVFSAADVYTPVWPWLSTQPQDRTWHPGLLGLARLKPGVSMETAQTELDQISGRLQQAFPEANRDVTFITVPAHTLMVQGSVRTGLFVLVGAVGGVLLIACINVAGLLLARGLGRKRDLAVRTAMGASRQHLMRLVLAESLILSLLGAVAGLLLAAVLVPTLVQMVGPTLLRADMVAINPRVLMFSLGLSVISALLFGLLPALSSARVDLRNVLSEGGRGSSGSRGQRRARRILVVAEIALTMALLVGAGLLMRSFIRLQDVSPGFTASKVLVAEVPLSPRTYAAHDVRTNAVESLLENVRAIPGVTGAAATTLLPLSGTGGTLHFNIEGRPPRSSSDWITLNFRAVTRSYLSTMEIPVRRGRGFGPEDRQGSPHVAVVTEAFARQFFPGEEVIGKRISLGTEFDGTEPWRTIVGVIGDILQSPDGDGKSELFVPYEQHPDNFFARMYQNITLAVRTAGEPATVTSGFRAAVKHMDPNQPIVNLRTMNDVKDAAVTQQRFRTTLLGMFAVMALILAGIGIYGLLAHGVAQRRGEFGVRLALGATATQITTLVIREGLVLAAAGLAIGAFIAVLTVRLVQWMLFGVTMWDAGAWVMSGAALVVVALVASWIPARRATKVAPSLALRE